MSYLSDFAATFTEQELLIFKNLDLKGKEEGLRDIYLREHKKTGWDELAIRKHLDISETHLDKLNSILLDKIITSMFGNDYDRAFFVILQKGLAT